MKEHKTRIVDILGKQEKRKDGRASFKDKDTFGIILNTAKQGIATLAQTKEPVLSKDPIQKKETHIETVDQLENALLALQGDISPAMLQVLKSQLQVLETINSPTMTGMMIDNLVQGLQQAVSQADDVNCNDVREAYIRIIQNYVFMAEAKMHYSVEKNKEESRRLLVECGKMLSDTFTDIATAAVPGAQGVALLKSIDGKTLFDVGTSVTKIIINKKKIEEKQNDFYDTIENLFDTFDKYPDLFGTSIVINGMLAKYRRILVDRFAADKVKVIKNRRSVAELQKASQLSSELTNTLNKGDFLGMVSASVKSAFDTVLARKATQYDLQTFFTMFDAFESEVKELKVALDSEELRLKELEKEQKNIGVLSFSKKKEAAQSVEEQRAKLKERKSDFNEAENKFKALKELFPEARAIKNEINRYEARLKSVEQKYLQ